MASLLQLHGGPFDGKWVLPAPTLSRRSWALPAEQRGMVVEHWYAADGEYLGARARRVTLWRRICQWWAGE